MELKERLRNAFLVMDAKKEGVLNDLTVVTALQSLGFVLNNDVKTKCKPLNCEQFIQFGEDLAKTLPSDGGVGALFDNLSGKNKSIDTSELKQIMDAMKTCNKDDFNEVLNALDPKGIGKFDREALVNAFKV